MACEKVASGFGYLLGMGFWQALLFPPLTTTSLSHDMANSCRSMSESLLNPNPLLFCLDIAKKMAIKKKIKKREFILKFSNMSIVFFLQIIVRKLTQYQPSILFATKWQKSDNKRKIQKQSIFLSFLTSLLSFSCRSISENLLYPNPPFFATIWQKSDNKIKNSK